MLVLSRTEQSPPRKPKPHTSSNRNVWAWILPVSTTYSFKLALRLEQIVSKSQCEMAPRPLTSASLSTQRFPTIFRSKKRTGGCLHLDVSTCYIFKLSVSQRKWCIFSLTRGRSWFNILALTSIIAGETNIKLTNGSRWLRMSTTNTEQQPRMRAITDETLSNPTLHHSKRQLDTKVGLSLCHLICHNKTILRTVNGASWYIFQVLCIRNSCRLFFSAITNHIGATVC